MRALGRSLVVAIPIAALLVPNSEAADLQPRTVAAFDRYVRLTEDRLRTGDAFLWIDSLSEPRRQQARAEVPKSELVIDRLTTKDGRKDIDVPDGLIHHWIGTAFVEGATIDQALTLLQSYDRHQQIYTPTVAASKLLAHAVDQNLTRGDVVDPPAMYPAPKMVTSVATKVTIESIMSRRYIFY